MLNSYLSGALCTSTLYVLMVHTQSQTSQPLTLSTSLFKVPLYCLSWALNRPFPYLCCCFCFIKHSDHCKKWGAGIMCTHVMRLLASLWERTLLRAWVKEQEVFCAAIICRFPCSLFPLCLAHISRTNSTPLAIPGVLESRPHSLGKALVAHGETAVDRHIAEHSVPYKHKTNPILHFIAVYRSLHLS